MSATRDDLVVTRWGARFRGRLFPCAIGRGGIVAEKREGDGGTPEAALRLVSGGFRADRLPMPRAPFPMAAQGHGDKWSDDAGDPAYNHAVTSRFYPFSHERMRRGDPLYDIVIVTDWNWPDAVPGKGSAIFVHCWKGPRKPTEGCVAFRRQDLIWILARWAPKSRLIIRS